MNYKSLTWLFAVTLAAGCGNPNANSVSTLNQDAGQTYKIYAALSGSPSASDPDAYRIMAASSLNLDASSVVFCLSSLEKCNADPNMARVPGVVQTVDGVKAWVSKSYVKMLEGTNVTVYAKDAAGATITQTIKISAN